MASHNHDHEILEDLNDLELRMLAEDIRYGLVPDFAHRAANVNELKSGINFLAFSDDVARAANELSIAMGAARAQFLTLLRGDLAQYGSVDEVVRRLQAHQALGISGVPGALDLLATTSAQLAPVLNELVRSSAEAVRAEAKHQGVEIAPVGEISSLGKSVVDRQAGRLVLEPFTDAIGFAADSVIEVPPSATVEELFGIFDQSNRALSEKPLTRLAASAGAAAGGTGRLEAATAAAASGRTPKSIYASELLDSNTCGFCRLVDGKKYANLAGARKDYPHGIYRLCEGGMLCRGLVVMVWSEE